MIKRDPNYQKFLDDFAVKHFGRKQDDKRCVFCGKEVKGTEDFKDWVSYDEWQITGQCQVCQDKMEESLKEEEDE